MSVFQTKSGVSVTVRSMARDDAQIMVDFINRVSAENTFIQFSGEQVFLEDEQRYVDSELELIGTEHAVKLLAFIDDLLVGIADVHRNTKVRTRKTHVGTFGLIVSQEYRGQGVGEGLMRATLEQAETAIPGLRLLYLECFANNQAALSLYKKMGFFEVGRIPGGLLRNRQYVDEVIMVKNVGDNS